MYITLYQLNIHLIYLTRIKMSKNNYLAILNKTINLKDMITRLKFISVLSKFTEILSKICE